MYFAQHETTHKWTEFCMENSERKLKKPAADIVKSAARYPGRRCPSDSILYARWAHYNHEPEMALNLAQQALATAQALVEEAERLVRHYDRKQD